VLRRSWVREHVEAVTGLLTVVSLALIFGAVFQALPVVPRASDAVLEAIPHVNAVVSLVAIGTIVAGWRWIRHGAIRNHRRAMVASLVLFAVFLALYLYRVSIEGPKTFRGPEALRSYVYLPLLAVHVTLAIVCVPLLYYVLLLGLTRPVHEIEDTAHARVGRVAAALWLVSFALGVVVYVLLYVLF
jgi:putative membrane protein